MVLKKKRTELSDSRSWRKIRHTFFCSDSEFRDQRNGDVVSNVQV